MPLTANDLQPGDVLLYHGSGFFSDLIRRFDGGEYSHASVYDGAAVVEALADGVNVNTIADSVRSCRYVDVYRFLSKDGKRLRDVGYPAQPILDQIGGFKANPQRYAYEQILLLALLTSTRKIGIPGVSFLLRQILDSAAGLLADLISAGREPVICSELVYRCYDQAGPAYKLLIRGADIATLAASATLRARPADLAAEAESDELAEAKSVFLDNYYAAKSAATAASVTAAVADFVTPNDLARSPNLQNAGRLAS